MANHTSANVIYVDTSAAFTNVRRIRTIKFIGDLGSSANITELKTDGSEDSSNRLWEQTGSQDTQGEPLEALDHDLSIRASDGVKVNVSGGAVVYLYVE